MTIEQFENTAFSANSKIIYNGKTYDVIMVDFEEFLIAIDEFPDDEDENKQLSWKCCENCEIIGGGSGFCVDNDIDMDIRH